MHINEITRTAVGADLSCPPPIYRPSLHISLPDYFVNDHDRAHRRSIGHPWISPYPGTKGKKT
jgi:hypothetical protein